jgi:hypothetical protein
VAEGAAGRRLLYTNIIGFPSAACRPFLLSLRGNLCHAEVLFKNFALLAL